MASRTLLLIDDEPEFARFVAHAAEGSGYKAVLTISADNFRRQYDEQTPDAVVLDLAMPGSDGVELLRFLAERGCSAPVIIISGFDRRVLESAMRLGEAQGLTMAGPVMKPVRLDELTQLFQSLAAAPSP